MAGPPKQLMEGAIPSKYILPKNERLESENLQGGPLLVIKWGHSPYKWPGYDPYMWLLKELVGAHLVPHLYFGAQNVRFSVVHRFLNAWESLDHDSWQS